MLEYDFNELDNDFITVWSKFMLGYDIIEIYNDIRRLAELGQVNAIQSYYVMQNLNIVNSNMEAFNIVNPVVKKFINEHNTDLNFDPNWALAEANALKLDFQRFYNAIVNSNMKKKQIVLDKLYKFDDNLVTGYAYLMKNNSSKHALQAQLDFMKKYNKTKNPLYLARSEEIKTALFLKSSLKDKTKLRNELEAVYKKNPESPQNAFTYAKFLMFNSLINKAYGKRILMKLANREYSKTLQDYNENYEKLESNNQTDYFLFLDNTCIRDGEKIAEFLEKEGFNFSYDFDEYSSKDTDHPEI